MIERQLSHPGLFDSSGKACYQNPDGHGCFLWIPEGEPVIYIYGCLLDIEPRVDGQLLAHALALNLEREMSGSGAIALNTQTHQLVFRMTYPVQRDTNITPLITQFLNRLVQLRQELQQGRGGRGKPSSGRERQTVPVFLQSGSLAWLHQTD
ncbi:CesT family type III secretion system chaperone [Vibrio mangrovi]|nr:CesT family type III secretion system chaperone [Vibrio mangrovi]MDW6004636.1 CesT family type III secretion system chaperone [Vibrio mangrovi]